MINHNTPDDVSKESQPIKGMASPKGSFFPPTRWPRILLAARRPETPLGMRAFGELFLAYAPPARAFARKCGYSPQDAEDLVQDFVSKLVKADKQLIKWEGPFRSFLKLKLKRFILNDIEEKKAAKRGGEAKPLPFDDLVQDDARFETALGHHWLKTRPAPDEYFDREWALSLIKIAKDRLRKDHESLRSEWWVTLEPFAFASEQADEVAKAANENNIEPAILERSLKDLEKFKIFKALEPHLLRKLEPHVYAELEKSLRLPQRLLPKKMERLKTKFKTLLKEVIADTLPEGADVEAEYRYLLGTLRSQVLKLHSSI